MTGDQDMELLSAYLDGELDADQTRKVRERLLSDPAFREAHDAIKANDELLMHFSAQVDDKPIPEELLELVSTGTQDGRRAYGFFASAAAVLLLVGGFLVMEKPSTGHDWLNNLESGEALAGVDGTPEVIASFRHQDGRYCREAKSETRRAVFCHTGTDWELVIEVVDDQVPAGSYLPAGSSTDEIDRYIRDNMQGMVLTLDEERELISNQWQDLSRVDE